MCCIARFMVSGNDVTRLQAHHVAHIWARTGTLEDSHLKQAIYSQLDPARHLRKGQQTHWQTNLASVFEDLWRAKACERKQWKANRLLYIYCGCDALLGHSSKPLGLKSISEVNPNGCGDLDLTTSGFLSRARTRGMGSAKFPLIWKHLLPAIRAVFLSRGCRLVFNKSRYCIIIATIGRQLLFWSFFCAMGRVGSIIEEIARRLLFEHC